MGNALFRGEKTTEWSIFDQVFKTIKSLGVIPQMDIFARLYSAHLDTFLALTPSRSMTTRILGSRLEQMALHLYFHQ